MKKALKLEKNTEIENLKDGELLNTSTSEENTDNKDYSKLVDQEEMEGYPVMMTRFRDSQQAEWGKWFAMIGQSKVSPEFETKEDLIEHFYNSGINAEFMSTLINVIAGHMNAIKAFQEELNKSK